MNQRSISMSQGRCGERIFQNSLMIASCHSRRGLMGQVHYTATGTGHLGSDPCQQHTSISAFRAPRLPFSLPNSIPPATPSSKRSVTFPAAARKSFPSSILSDHQIARGSRIHTVIPVSGSWAAFINPPIPWSSTTPQGTVSRMGLGYLI
jgi:hypothetical protein